MAGRKRGGRPWGPIRADSTEAKELAEFLREQVDFSGRTLAQLAEQIRVSKSQISVGLAGKVPETAFVTALIHATIPEPRLREKRLEKARELLQAAAHPSPANPVPPTASEVEIARLRAQQMETYDRLTRSLEAQNQLHEAAGNSAKLVMVLLTMINRLEQRITELTGKRDQRRAAHVGTDTLHQIQQKLTRAQEQEQRAQQELLRAQDKLRQAETLAAAIQAQVDRLTDELDRLRNPITSVGTGTDDTANTYSPYTTAAHTTTDPVGDDFDQALARITAVNDHDDQLLHDITHNLHQEPDPGQDVDADSWRVIQDNPPDNLPTSPDTADNLTGRQQGAEAADDGGAYPTALLPDGHRFSSVLVSFGGTVPTTGLHGVRSLTPSVLVLNDTGKILSEDYVLHPEHTKTDDGSVALFSDREEWTHDLPREQGRHLAVVKLKDLPAKAHRVLFVVSVSAGASRMGALPQRSRAHAEVFDTATMRQLACIAPPEFTDGYAAVIADLRREPTGWSFQAATQSGLNARTIARSYGARSYPHSMWF